MSRHVIRPDRVPFTLSPADHALAYRAARDRREDSLRRGITEKHGATRWDGKGEDRDFTGCLAEVAVARWNGQSTWVPVHGTFKKPDIALIGGPVAQVRGRSAPWHDLIIREDDAPGQVFIHVTLTSQDSPRGYLQGWILTSEGWRDEWWDAKPPRINDWAWWVPSIAQRPMTTLLEYKV